MITAMQNAGLDPGSIITDGKLHRFDVPGDRAKSLNGWYVFYDGDIQAGRFGSWKTGDNISWCSKSKTEFSPEEKKAYAAKQAEARRLRDTELAKIHEECRAACKILWEASAPANSNHPYLLRKQVISHGLRQSGDSLMVPVKDIKGVLHGIQFIKPDKTDNGKDKIFKTGTAKQGHFHIIGKPVDNTMIICEGYATGASIHEATGHAVLVAFDCGNLKSVAEVVRGKYPQWVIIIAADNDQWTDGNPGIKHGRDAAMAVKGECRIPKFIDLTGKPTDFNDLHILYGLSAVKTCIFPPPMAEYDLDYIPNDEEPPPTPEEFYNEDESPNPFTGAPFKLLGYNRGEYFYLPHGTKQIKVLKAPEHTKAHLMELAKLQWWQGSEFANKSGFDTDAAANAMIQINQGIGVYDSGKIRGRGAWFDDGRSIVHVGDELIVDGKTVKIEKIKSEFVYEKSVKMGFSIGSQSLKNQEAIRLQELCDTLSWSRPEFGMLVSGWAALSATCGALTWRPHILITGAAATGKTWVVDNIVRPVAGNFALIVQGATSEAGIRQALGADARPVIFDEAEGEDQKAHARMQQILELARQASSETGGSIYKGTMGGKSQAFRIRSMFCFASIRASQTQAADQSRITVLTLKQRRDKEKHFKDVIKPLKNEILTEEFCKNLRKRMINNIPIIRPSADIFSDALSHVLDSKRTGDQIGALLAGNWALRSTNIVSPSEAMKIANSVDWSEHKIGQEQTDEQRCLATILETLIRMPSGDNVSVGELIRTVAKQMFIDENSPSQMALKNHGIRVVDGGFCIANQHTELKKIMERTPWPANWSQIIGRLPGAATPEKPTWFSGGAIRTKMLPLSYVEEC